MLVCLVASVALGTASAAVTAADSSPYNGIVERNLLGLRPPPPPPDPEAANKPQPSKITLTGITTILGRKLALMKTPPRPPKPGEQAKTEESYTLGIGELQDEVEVLEIDEVAGTVKVKNAGILETVSFDQNGAKPALGVPGAPPPPMGVTPGANLYPPAPGANAPTSVPMPNRIPRMPLPGSSPLAGTGPGGSPYAGTAPATYGGTPTPSVKPGNVPLPVGSQPRTALGAIPNAYGTVGGVPAQAVPNPANAGPGASKSP